MQSLMPEFFMLLGIDFFLATSLLVCVLERYFPDKLCYLYQLLGLAGFGQLLVTREFMASFADYMRFWYSFAYLALAVMNVVGLNLYLFLYKRKMLVAKVFSLIATAPVTIISVMFFANYTAVAAHPIVALQVPLDVLFISVFIFDTMVVIVGIYALLKPKLWQIAVPTVSLIVGGGAFMTIKPMLGEALFIAGTIYIYIFMGIACFGILGASLFVLLRAWLETKKPEVN